MPEDSSFNRPRGLPRTWAHLVGLCALGTVSSVLVLPVVTIPTSLGYVLFFGDKGINLWTPFFGVFLASAYIGLENTQTSFYKSGDSDSILEKIDELDDDELIRLAVILVLMVLYINLAFASGIIGMALFPEYSTALGILVPIFDRSLIGMTGYSPIMIVIFALAVGIEMTGTVRDIDFDKLRRLNLNPAV